MNELTKKYNDVKFVALFHRVADIDNYTKGTLYEKHGFLNEDWTILQNKPILFFLLDNYTDNTGYPFIFFRKNGKDLGAYPDYREVEVIEKNISDHFQK